MRQVLTIIKFEYLTFVRSGAFIGATIFMMLAGIIAPTVPTVITLSHQEGSFLQSIFGGEAKPIAVADKYGLFTDDDFRNSLDHEVRRYESAEDARLSVVNGESDYAVVTGRNPVVTFVEDGYTYTIFVPEMELSTVEIQSKIENMLRLKYQEDKLTAAGIALDEVNAVLGYSPPGEVFSVSSENEGVGDYLENVIYAYALVMLLYFALISCGQYVLTSVIREKATKTMELLITSCKSWKLINGKVLGVGLAGLTQNFLLALSALTSMGLNGFAMLSVMNKTAADFQVSVRLEILLLMLVFFLLGFFIYAYLFAGLASSVERMEDAGSAMAVPMFLIIGSFFAALFGLMSPGETWVTVLSYVPFFTPMVMFMRICLQTAETWEIWLSVLLQLTSIMTVGRVSAFIYRRGTLTYGNKLRLSDLI